MPFLGLGVLVCIAFLSWILKMIYKQRLESGLGRKVKDNELTSISAWMETEPKEGRR